MKVKILQLNIEGGRKLADVIAYIKHESFSVVQLQEVAGGSLSRTGFDTWEALQKELGYKGELVQYIVLKNAPQSYSGIATLFHPSLNFDEKNVFWLRDFYELSSFDRSNVELIRDLPRCVLALRFLVAQKPVWCINTHLAWGPTPADEPYKVEQGQKMIAFVQSLKDSFVLSGDFNVTSDSAVVTGLEKFGENHARKHGITNTLNPTLHRAQNLFPAGLGVDFLFTSPDLKTADFSLVDTPDLSDHYGLKITLEV